ncbi:exodeoxyribonuclease V, alpha subunit [Actinobacillus minor NM305]|uniref:RecBCD enzyme subunit RecD n=1 Tax=Actinobacillus minor NM305 TaxID=637911 RepID=C5S1V3_9PAST|nr:exodeoxyribonuclease V subunit alpha [Actinobacillus minor]EER47143.1 exodeoxyribonuclease V, alpha subunit [Actinobacillus minor NM305]
MLKLLEKLKSENVISELNYQFAKMIDRKQQGFGYTVQQQNLAVLVAALLSFHTMKGHSALSLNSDSATDPFGLSLKKEYELQMDFANEILQKIEYISPLEWQALLANHIAFSVSPEKAAPMLFQYGLLYFYRYWQAEHQVANYLQQAVGSFEENANLEQDKKILDQLFGQAGEQIDWQKIAVATALRKRFCVISGGPGTGKTRTVARLLAALQWKQFEQGADFLKVALIAPTGKAAARLKESIVQNLASIEMPEKLKGVLPTQASTIHRLLGMQPQSDKPKYHKTNPLHLDLLVVDEASMIDLSLMEKLLNAVKPSTRVILLGDKDQLASVEVGSIMGELGQFIRLGYSQEHCNYLEVVTGYKLTGQTKALPICDSLCHLRQSYRFDADSGIGLLAKEVNEKHSAKSWQVISSSAHEELEYISYPPATNFSEKRQWLQYCVALVVRRAVEVYRDYLELVKQRENDPKSVSVGRIFEAFQQVRFLSALRVGELGVERLNQTIAEALKQANLVKFNQHRENYCGKPILITENAPQNHVYSGDIGIVLPDEQGMLRIYFDTIIEGEYLNLSLSRVPEYESAYVMTVHKSQGSEFNHVFLVMPLASSPVLTKELIYTAITRAKEKFTLFSHEKVWKQGVKSDIQRQSGLQEQLKNKLS